MRAFIDQAANKSLVCDASAYWPQRPTAQSLAVKNMKTILAIIIFSFSTLCWSFEHNVVKGQWGVIQDNSYYFLNISNDYSGTLVRALGHEPIVNDFSANDVIKRDGYLEIKLRPNEKAVLSAWKLESGSGRLTGQVFMYKDSGELFNMLYFPLQLLEPNHEFLNNATIKQLSERYR